jgi:hypothetical protein
MLKLHSTSLRNGLKEVLNSVNEELVIASPYIKTSEAEWVCDELERRRPAASVRLQVLTDVRSANVLSGSLDIEALNLFSARIPQSVVVNLPRLHAKVYVADRSCALVTSANLTPSGMDFNFEFGVEFHDSEFVGNVRRDLESYSRLGNVLSRQSLVDLQLVADELSDEFQKVQKSAASDLKRRFSEKLRAANYQFLRAQVGTRSAHSLFSEAILYALAATPLSTVELHPKVQKLLPDLCDDSVELVINGQQFGKRWKHAVRNAQQYLKRSGQIVFDGKRWSLAQSHR